MQRFKIQQQYQEAYFREVEVRAHSLAEAIGLANEQSEAFDEDEVNATAGVPAVLVCGEWQNGSDLRWPTFTVSAEADRLDCDEQLVVPPDFRQFRTEWAGKSSLIRQLADAVRELMTCYVDNFTGATDEAKWRFVTAHDAGRNAIDALNRHPDA